MQHQQHSHHCYCREGYYCLYSFLTSSLPLNTPSLQAQNLAVSRRSLLQDNASSAPDSDDGPQPAQVPIAALTPTTYNTTEASAPPSTDSSVPLWAIVTAVTGTTVLVFVLVLVFVWMWARHSAMKAKPGVVSNPPSGSLSNSAYSAGLKAPSNPSRSSTRCEGDSKLLLGRFERKLNSACDLPREPGAHPSELSAQSGSSRFTTSGKINVPTGGDSHRAVLHASASRVSSQKHSGSRISLDESMHEVRSIDDLGTQSLQETSGLGSGLGSRFRMLRDRENSNDNEFQLTDVAKTVRVLNKTWVEQQGGESFMGSQDEVFCYPFLSCLLTVSSHSFTPCCVSVEFMTHCYPGFDVIASREHHSNKSRD